MKKRFINTKLNNNIIIYDYETGDKNQYTTEPLEVAAICADINTLEIKKDCDGNVLLFHTLIKPTDWSLVKDEALAKNKITRQEIEENGVNQEFFFNQFSGFCRQFAKSDKKWDQPYAAGFNIQKFDNVITERLCQKYNYLDKDNDSLIFHPFHFFDLAHIARMYFAWNDDLSSYSLDSLREYFGISKEGSHRADKDVMDTWLILKRFIAYFKQASPKMLPKFKGAFQTNE